MAMAQCVCAPCYTGIQRRLVHSSTRTSSRFQVNCKVQGMKNAAVSSASSMKKKVGSKEKKRVEKRIVDLDDGEEVVMSNMSEWMKNKPSGFGLQEYETVLEDQILADIEKEGKLRAEAEAKRKQDMEAKKTQQLLEKKALAKKPEAPDGVKVQVKYLPRKKNIERDLRPILKTVRGFLHIRPNELGNSKTRDPVCKGNAILTFVDEKHALSFIEKYQGQKFTFGKVEKRLGFELYKKKERPALQSNLSTGGPRLKVLDKDGVRNSETLSTPLLEDEASRKCLQSGVEHVGSTESSSDFSEDDVVVQDSVADAILGSEESEATVSEDEDRESEEHSDEDERFLFKVPQSVLEMAKELGDEEEDSSYSDEDEEVVGAVDEGEEFEEEPVLGDKDCIEVDLALPKMDIEQREEILKTSEQKISELDGQIEQLSKKLKRRRTQKLEDEILRLREEKIELLEKRILAKVMAEKEARRRKRDKRKLLQTQNSSERGRRKLLSDVLSRSSR